VLSPPWALRGGHVPSAGDGRGFRGPEGGWVTQLHRRQLMGEEEGGTAHLAPDSAPGSSLGGIPRLGGGATPGGSGGGRDVRDVFMSREQELELREGITAAAQTVTAEQQARKVMSKSLCRYEICVVLCRYECPMLSAIVQEPVQGD
jgi:hypothetical protein